MWYHSGLAVQINRKGHKSSPTFSISVTTASSLLLLVNTTLTLSRATLNVAAEKQYSHFIPTYFVPPPHQQHRPLFFPISFPHNLSLGQKATSKGSACHAVFYSHFQPHCLPHPALSRFFRFLFTSTPPKTCILPKLLRCHHSPLCWLSSDYCLLTRPYLSSTCLLLLILCIGCRLWGRTWVFLC